MGVVLSHFMKQLHLNPFLDTYKYMFKKLLPW